MLLIENNCFILSSETDKSNKSYIYNTHNEQIFMNEILDSEHSKETTEGTADTSNLHSEEISADSMDKDNVNQNEDDVATKETLVEKMQNILSGESMPPRTQLESIRYTFENIVLAEKEKIQSEFLSQGGDIKDFVPPIFQEELKFKELYHQIKQKRAQLIEQEENERNNNYLRKLEIIKELSTLGQDESAVDFRTQFDRFKQLQNQWKEIKNVPPSKEKELRDAYKAQSEHFYDLVRLNNEMRDYDFKKNLEIKNGIIEAVERLQNETDVISAFRQLQNLKEEWYETGPVAKELRDELWSKFKQAAAIIHQKHQAHFDNQKAQEQENLTLKTQLCEKIEAIQIASIKTMKEWEAATKEILDLQAQWKKIGFAPKKMNTEIYERFRATCNIFFEEKAKAAKSFKDELEQNLKKKINLCEAAEALKDSTEWKETAHKLMELQKEWKTIGQVARKHSDEVWNRFVAACDYFFEQKKKQNDTDKSQEKENLEKKKHIIEQINNISPEQAADEAHTILQELIKQWNSIGFVPFKDKNKIQKSYQEALDKQFERLRIEKNEQRVIEFRSLMEGSQGSLAKEKQRLRRLYDRIKNEVQTYENNLGFLSVSTKGGTGLLKDMEHKIQRLKNELHVLEQKMEAIDSIKEEEK